MFFGSLDDNIVKIKVRTKRGTGPKLRLFRPKACSPDGDSPEAKDDSPDDTNQ